MMKKEGVIKKMIIRQAVLITCKEHLISFYEGFGYIHQGQASSTHGNAIWHSMLLEF